MAFADPRDANYIASANKAACGRPGGRLLRASVRSSNAAASPSTTVTRAVANFRVAIPSWGVGTGGTRFGRFPGPGEPRNVFEKLEDCGVIHR